MLISFFCCAWVVGGVVPRFRMLQRVGDLTHALTQRRVLGTGLTCSRQVLGLLYPPGGNGIEQNKVSAYCFYPL